MALKKFDTTVNLYDDKAKISTGITVGDTVEFTVQVLDKAGHPVDLTEVNTISVFVKKNDNSEYQDACFVADTSGGCLKLISPENGYIRIVLGGGATSSPGICYATITFYDSADEEKTTSGRFAYYVKESTATDDFARVSEYKSLDNLITALAKYDGDLAQLKYYLGLYEGALEDVGSTEGLATLSAVYNGFVPKTATIAGMPLSDNITKAELLAALGVTAQENVTYPIPISKGGTGATTAADARKALGIDGSGGTSTITWKDISYAVTPVRSAEHVKQTVSARYCAALGLVYLTAVSASRKNSIPADTSARDQMWDIDLAYAPKSEVALAITAGTKATVRAVVDSNGIIGVGAAGVEIGGQIKIRVSGMWLVGV